MTKKEKEDKQRQWKELERELRTKTFIDNMFYEDDFTDYDYTDDKETISKRVTELKEYMESIEIDEKLKSNILDNNEFLELLSHFDITELLNKYSDEAVIDRIYELAQDYDHINNFFKDKDAYTILNLYGVVDKDDNGFYQLNDNIVNRIIQENDYYIESEDKQEEIKKLIFSNWENQKEIITPEKLDKYSEKRNGINFKYFLFCEEYIKSGKMTDVAKKLGIGRRTCYDYLQKKEVKQYLQERQEEIKEENTNLMKQRFNECFDTLYDMGVKNKDNPYTADSIKIKAIDIFLKHYENSVLKPTNTDE